jgi:hypothetical protein
MSFADRLMRQVGPHVSAGADIVAIDMATSPDVDPPGPVGVVVTSAELLLVASGRDGGHLTTIPADEIVGVSTTDPECVTIRVSSGDGDTRQVLLDFRYFGITDDTVSKLRTRFLEPVE